MRPLYIYTKTIRLLTLVFYASLRLVDYLLVENSGS